MKYKVIWLITTAEEECIEADSEDEAIRKWEDLGTGGDLFIVEDERGNQTIF